MRRIEMLIPEDLHKSISGVYIFKIGYMFYIGRSIKVRSRLLAHIKKINECIANYATISNGCFSTKKHMRDMYFRIAKYIHEHPKIKHMEIISVYDCNSHIDMCGRENSLLRLYENHPDLFNSTFSASIFDRPLPEKKVLVRRNNLQPQKDRPTRQQLLSLLKKLRTKNAT